MANRLNRILKSQELILKINGFPRAKPSFDSAREMYGKSDGTCDICGQMPKRHLAIDHCHATGSLRGLLCHHCNVGLGHFRDDAALLAKAIDYIKKYSG